MRILTRVHRGNNLSRPYHIPGGRPVRAGSVGVVLRQVSFLVLWLPQAVSFHQRFKVFHSYITRAI